MRVTADDVSMDLPNSGLIHTLPATSSWLVCSRDFKYSLSDFSSSTLAHGKAILNIPVALTKPSLLLRCHRVHELVLPAIDSGLQVHMHRDSPSKSRSPGAGRESVKERSPSPASPWAEVPVDGHTRTAPDFQAWSHWRYQSGRP